MLPQFFLKLQLFKFASFLLLYLQGPFNTFGNAELLTTFSNNIVETCRQNFCSGPPQAFSACERIFTSLKTNLQAFHF